MLAKLNAFALHGIDAVPVEVEVDAAPGQAKTILVGLPELAVRESVHRIERALANLGYRRPTGRTIVNLAPADLRKDAGAFDLPIALGMLVATGQILPDQLVDWASVGELALDGALRPVKGTLSIAMAARDRGIKKLLVPAANAREAAVVKEIEVYAATNLSEAVGLITELVSVDPVAHVPPSEQGHGKHYDVDFADVRGQEFAKRAMVIAASGRHNILLLGSPGSGKSMISKRLPTILPDLTPNESLETTRIYSSMGLLRDGESLLSARPFRSPHHTISDAGMVGGGTIPNPGEISLAHHGILFLDEFPEFNRGALEVLRQPLEDGQVTISRASGSTTFPANFILVAAMNPCPCGYLGDAKRACKCSPIQIEKYHGRLSGPLLDRIDLHVEVPAVPFDELTAKIDGSSSATMNRQVQMARECQRQRFGGDGSMLNGRMVGRSIREHCKLDAAGTDLLRNAIDDLGLSARAHDRILRVARTIADLEGHTRIAENHIAEAIGYRTLDRKLWSGDNVTPFTLAQLREKLTAAVVCDALDSLGLTHQCPRLPLRPLTVPGVLIGRCKTTLWADMAHVDPKPYAMELQAVDSCKPDDVLIAAAGGSMRSGIWGELLTTAARNCGCVGVIVDGAVRDVPRMREMSFPVFARGTCLYDSKDRQRVIDIDVCVEIDGVRIHPGDLIVADEDGIVVIPQNVEAEAIQRAWDKVHAENQVRDAIRVGMKAQTAFDTFGVL